MIDEAAINTTLSRYGWGIDAGDAQLVAGCFTHGGELVAPDGSTLEGRQAIHDDVVSRRTARAARGIVRHLTVNALVTPEGAGRARVRSTWMATALSGGTTAIFGTGWYDDTFVADGDAWRIERRMIHMDGR